MDLIKIGTLWKRVSKDGTKTFYSGPFQDGQLIIFKNQHKKAKNHPDLLVYVGSKQKRDDSVEPDGGTRF